MQFFKAVKYNREHEAPQPRSIWDYYKLVNFKNALGIRRQPMDASNFESKLVLITMVQQNQFGGCASENPSVHLAMFLQVTDTIKMNRSCENAIYLKIFPIFFIDKALNGL